MLTYSNLHKLIDDCIDNCFEKYHINESIRQTNTPDKKYEKWKELFDLYMYDMIDCLQKEYLDKLHILIKVDYNYIFSGRKSRWLASYERSSDEILNGIILIGINYKNLYNKMCELHIDKDDFNIEAQARITIGHEIGHGIVDYIRHLNISTDELPNLKKVKYCGEKHEEKIVEEFGEYQFPEATGCWSSIICDALIELDNLS